MVIEGFNETAEAKFKVDKWIAWHVAAGVRSKKMLDFEKFVNPRKVSGDPENDFKVFLMAHNQRLRANDK